MTQVVTESTVEAHELERFLRPRDGFVLEKPTGDGRFGVEEGPVSEYERTVTLQPLADGRVRVIEQVEFVLAIPYFAWMFVWAVKREVARGGENGRNAWWAPAVRLDARAASILGTLAMVAIVLGWLNTMFDETIAFAADEFGAGNRAQGVAGAAVRLGGMLAFAVLAGADRRGRRKTLIEATVLGCALTAIGAFSPSLPWLTASQVLGRGFAQAMLVMLGIIVVEEMPAGARAYTLSLLTLAAGLGAGGPTIALKLADLGRRAWRLIYLLSALFLLIVPGIARRLPESRRFERRTDVAFKGHGYRLSLLAASLFLVNLSIAPSSQFTNRFLKHERGYNGGRIALLNVVTGTPAALGVVVGGRLADVRGRRVVAAVALALGTVLSVAFFFTRGWAMWAWTLAGNVVFAASIPALLVYGPELFPTSLRGRANGAITVIGLVGSAVGLVVAGVLAQHFGHIGPGIAVVAVGPLALAVILLAAYPETARRELEEINPKDLPPD